MIFISVLSANELKKDQVGRIVAIKNQGLLKRRLLDMGITCGTIIKIKKVAPLGDPVDIEVRGYELCLRLTSLKLIIVEVIL